MKNSAPRREPLDSRPSGLQDDSSSQLMEASRSLRALVREAAARLREARSPVQADRIAYGFGKGNGERFHASRY